MRWRPSSTFRATGSKPTSSPSCARFTSGGSSSWMATATADRPRAGQRLARPLRSYAFGLELEAAFEAPGLPAAGAPAGLPRSRLALAPREEIEARWRPAAPVRLLEEEFGAAGRATRTIDHDPDVGYRLYARHFGLALISAGGREVLCAPPGVAAWRWQRFLVGRVLPWAALVSGREVIHASAVRVGDRAVALLAPTGGGKTSLAARLVLGGAGFITDDVLAVELRDGGVLAHPGASIVAVRPAEKAALSRGDLRRLGRVLGTSGKTYVAVDREHEPLPLGAVYVLTPGDGPRIEDGGVGAPALLGSSFVSSVTTPARLERLLDVCSTIASGVPMFRAFVDSGSG